MRRPYAFQYFSELIAHIRTRLPHASIGSDVIVGFPGETDEDFEELAASLDASPLSHLHVFPYSDRPGTAAAEMTDKVPGPIVRDRGTRLRQISERLARRFKAAQTGTVARALTIDDGATVVTGNYLKLRIEPGRSRNEWVTVAVTDDGAGLRGVVLNA
jgi:threonylcarbamoyladenosine tRNA methylthiotransferase MtaB